MAWKFLWECLMPSLVDWVRRSTEYQQIRRGGGFVRIPPDLITRSDNMTVYALLRLSGGRSKRSAYLR